MLINRERIIQSIDYNPHANNYYKMIENELKQLDLDNILKNVIDNKDLYKSGFALLKMSFYYLITKNEKYKQFIKDFSLAFCNAPKWENQVARNGWTSDLLTGDLSFNLSLSFYLCKDIYEESEKDFILKSIIEKGFNPLYNEWVNPETKIHCLDTMGHNWWSVCIGGLGGLVLTLNDDYPNKFKYLNEIVSCLKEWLAYEGDLYLNKHANFGSEGDYIEYVGYMLYGLANFISFEELYRRATGDTTLFDISPLEKTVDYIISCLQKIDGKWRFPNFGDTKDENGCRHIFLYLANHYNRGELLEVYENLLTDGNSAFDFIFFETLSISKSPIAFKPLTVYPHSGYAFVHGKNDFLFAIKTGETGCHNHRDNGTFTLSYKNKELIIDSGTCPYSDKEYLRYFCAPEAHNVILFNGEGIREDGMYGGGVATVGEIASYINEPNYKYILADCTKPYQNILQKNMRHVIILDDIIFMIDDIYTEHDGEAEFLLHYDGNVIINDNGIEIENGEVSLKVIPLMPENREIITKEGLIYKKQLKKTKYLSINGNTKLKHIKFITAFILNDEININQIKKDDIYELNLTRNGIKERLIINYLSEKKDTFNNAHIIYDNIKTNAFITYLREKDGILQEAAITNGFYLYHNCKKIYSSLKNRDLYLR